MPNARYALIGIGGIFLLFVFSVNVLIPSFFKTSYSVEIAQGNETLNEPEVPKVEHLATPRPLKALYMTACVASMPSWRTSLKSLIETTELNAVVIDIKDYTGTVSFKNDFPKSGTTKQGCVVPDLKEFIAELHQSNIYVIGRVSVFQDVSYSTLFPELAVKSKATGGVWKDRKGLSFIDVGATPYWDYIVEISKASYNLGFDELNYDYIRYPSDGDMDDTNFTWMKASSTRAEMLEGFFSYLDDKTEDIGVVTSADVFGMTTTIENDMGIGQVLERALPYFDYVAPMVYPSHYPNGWNGFANPADHPYEVIHIAMGRGREREVALNARMGIATTTPSKLRTWVQDFNLGATYGPDKVRAQIQATYDADIESWMLWNAGNKYTASALLSE